MGGSALVGREPEIAALTSALEETTAGRGRAVIVSGPPGIGKSALVENVAALARAQGASVQWWRCFAAGGAPPLWAWRQLLRPVIAEHLSALDAEARRAAAILAPDLASAPEPAARNAGATLVPDPTSAPEPAAMSLESEESRFRLFDGVARILAHAAAAAPLVLVIEDVHEADTASAELLQFAVGATATAPCLIAATVREGDGSGAVLALPGAERLRLAGLGTDAIATLAETVARGQVPSAAARAIVDATGGNPLFAIALVRHLVATDGLSAFGRTDAALPVPVPDTVRAVFDARLARLPAGTTHDLASLAATGREIEPVLATELLGERLDEVVEAGLGDGVLERDPLSGRIRFVHALAQAALLERLRPGDRATTHEKVAAAIERIHCDDLVPHLALLAHHLAQAGRGSAARAFEFARRAGDHARAVGAFADAATQYRRALGVGAAAAAERDRCDVLAALGEVEIRNGDVEEGRRRCRDAWELARRIGHHDAMADAALAFAHLPDGGVVNDEVVRLLRGALAEIGDGGRSRRARLLARLSSEVMYVDGEAAADLVQEAVAEARSTGDPSAIAFTLERAQSVMSLPKHAHQCLAWADEAVAAAGAADDPTRRSETAAYRSVHSLVLGRIDVYTRDVAMLSQLAEKVPTPLNRWYVLVASVFRAMLDGRFDDAASSVDQTLEFASSVGNALPSWQFQRFSLAWEREDLDEFESILQLMIQTRPGVASMARSALVLIHATTGRHEEAEAELLLAAEELAGRQGPWVWLLSMGWLVEAATMLGQQQVAKTLSDALAPYADLHVVGGTGTVAAYWGSVRRHLGNLALLLGDSEAAVAHGEAALAAHVRVGSVPYTVRSQHDLGRALLARSRPHDELRAGALLAEAAGTARRIGMIRFLDGAAAPPTTAPERSSVPRFVREGDYWTLAYRSTVIRLRDAKGVGYLAELLRQPGREILALDLASPHRPRGVGTDGASGDALDSTARDQYRRRLQDLEEDMAEADAAADIERAARLRHEWDLLVDELGRAAGIGGRSRTLGTAPSEAARIAVTKAIRGVLRRIEAADAELGRHFRATIRTGTFCAYGGDLEPCLTWQVTDR